MLQFITHGGIAENITTAAISGCRGALPDLAALLRTHHLVALNAAEGLEELRHVRHRPVQAEAR